VDQYGIAPSQPQPAEVGDQIGTGDEGFPGRGHGPEP
jgi:hypothetical protein